MKFKNKTKSSAKKRFKLKKNCIIITQSKKRHNASKLSSRASVVQRGTTVAKKGDAILIKKYMYK